MSPRQSSERGKKAMKILSYYKCSSCQYKSDRYYNVTRHEFRIHSASSRRRYCCGMVFVTKGEHYVHCEEYHPHSRTGNLISRTKTKLRSGVVETRDDSESWNERIEEKVARRVPYLLRTRAKASRSSTNDDRSEDSDFTESSLDTGSPGQNASTGSNASSRESSGYGGKRSSLETNDNYFPSDSSNESSDTASDSSMKNRSEQTKEFDESIHASFEKNSKEKDESKENSFPRKKKDESKENSFSHVSTSESLYLPIKKRILREIEINDGGNVIESRNSIVDRSHRRIREDENCNKVEVRADPRISWHEFTEQHREYFERLLLNRSILDRFRQI